MPDSGRKDLIPMKRPLAYITAPWSENEFENTENAAKYPPKSKNIFFGGTIYGFL